MELRNGLGENSIEKGQGDSTALFIENLCKGVRTLSMAALSSGASGVVDDVVLADIWNG